LGSETTGGAMTIQLITHGDALRHTAKRVVVAVSLTVALTLAMTLMRFGTDPDASVRAGFVTVSVIGIGIIVSALLTAGLSYRSALVMQELTLTRAELLRISRTDQLTGLLNRRGFDEAAISALAKAHEENLSAVALMCDIDRFKAINDGFGHEFGDKVLVQIGDVLRTFAQENGMLVARLGGEEFAPLMIGVTNEQAIQYAEALLRACAAKEVLSEDISAHVTVSIGLTSSHDEINLSKIMRIADQALYVAKHGGRNRVARADVLTDSLAA
jgi:diguanylate cyclase (GGDEF)-like protein